jgi:hypothetical protein
MRARDDEGTGSASSGFAARGPAGATGAGPGVAGLDKKRRPETLRAPAW